MGRELPAGSPHVQIPYFTRTLCGKTSASANVAHPAPATTRISDLAAVTSAYVSNPIRATRCLLAFVRAYWDLGGAEMSACSMSWSACQRAALIALVSGVVLIGAAACQKPASNSEKNGITSRAITTEQRQDGTRVVRQSTPQEVSALDYLAKATDKVDQEFPAPPLNPNMGTHHQ